MQSNAESSVGLLTLAGRSARILITSTRDLGRVFTSMHSVKCDGESDVVAGILKAQLALKHRQNSLQRQRIILFIASPISTPTETLVRLAKNLKKNSVAVDVINVGVEGDNVKKIDAFMDAVNSNDNSHALHVEADGGMNLTDAVMNSHINLDASGNASGSGVPAGAGVGTGGGGEMGGMGGEGADPALEMALRLSMADERARQARQAEEEQQQEETGGTTTDAAGDGVNNNEAEVAAGSSSAEPKEEGAASTSKYDDDDGDLYGTGDAAEAEGMEVDYEEEEAEMLRRAIELSNREAEEADAAAAALATVSDTSKEEKTEDAAKNNKGS